jgi:hypothetical protein
MKKLIPLIVLFAISISCEKDDDDVIYTQAQLNGVWESTERNSFDCVKRIEFINTNFSEINICSGVPIKLKAENYSFDGKIFKYTLYGVEHEYEITELSDTIMKVGKNNPILYLRISY